MECVLTEGFDGELECCDMTVNSKLLAVEFHFTHVHDIILTYDEQINLCSCVILRVA